MADIRKRKGRSGVGWQVRYKEPVSGHIRYKSFARRMDADAFVATLGHHDFLHDRDTVTVSEAASRWLDVCENTGRKGREPVEGSTLRKYREHVEIIAAKIGNVRLNQLTPVMCDEFRDNLLRDFSRKYAKKILTSFKSILAQARTDGRLRSDPAESTAILISQRHEKKEDMAIPSLAEVRALLAKAHELRKSANRQTEKAWARYEPFFLVLAYSGMRPCEVIGLPWRDVNFEKRTITVSQDATETREIGLPKSASSYRTIHMPDLVIDALRAWKAHCPHSEFDLVFPTGTGMVESHGNITNRGWYVLQRACGIVDSAGRPRYPLKSLRHVRASLEIHSGATPKEVQALMGHSSVKITFDVYGHLFSDHTHLRAERANIIAAQLSACGEFVASA
ncbi:tyrosine-type recombinase/integrase [Mycoplana ramosa]|uniref:Tyrosine-type recombinase/integrase n=1 Tax=Mycoplana ramosa TaxID=40837 RepID=A0ABW3YY97_MYCRA